LIKFKDQFDFVLLEDELGIISIGSSMRIARSDNIKPPIVPDANGNQKLSWVSPITNGMKPSTVVSTVSIIDVILALNALK
jgi:hypothetical protein